MPKKGMKDKTFHARIEKESEVTLCSVCSEPFTKKNPQEDCGYCGLACHQNDCVEEHEQDCDQNPDNMDIDEYKAVYGSHGGEDEE